jgi:Arc/MetJ-type ribon-helix-helix transcriptional regulator
MPRPKSDLKLISVDLGDADRAMLAELATHPDTPTKSEVIRVAIRKLHESRRRKSEKKSR